MPKHHGPRTIRRLADPADAKPYELFEVRPLTPTIGAHISGVSMAEPLTAPLRAEIHRALLEWKVVFFREQDITAEQHIEFSRNWGELEVHPALRAGSSPEIVRFEKGGEAVNPLTAGYENAWHSDVSWRSAPSLGSLLHAIEVPEQGGDTLWADMYVALDQIPAEVRARIEGRTAVHSFMRAFGAQVPAEKRDELAAMYPDQEHPVIRVHPETTRPLLYVNSIFTSRIVGLPQDESDELLDLLFRFVEIPEVQCRWKWSPGDVAFWDNRATQHYAASDYFPSRRVMERVTVVGDRPF